jgi:flagellar basal body-associated protein FliL
MEPASRGAAAEKESQGQMTGSLLVAIAVAAVTCVLLAGLYTLWVGGEVSATWSNRLMRIRVLAQFVAVVIIMAVIYFSGR